LRIAFDMDGVLADFESAFREIEVRLFGDEIPPPPEQPEARAAEEAKAEVPRRRRATDQPEPAQQPADEEEGPRLPTRRKLDAVWAAIEATPDFWTTLKPLDPSAVKRIKDMMLQHGWEVFFITQRPRTAGESVQRQTQRWLVKQGFDWPSVLVMPGSRGKAAAALHLDYLVDDSPKNCVDVISDSRARALLVLPEHDERVEASARRLGIGVVGSIGKCLDILEQATEVRGQPSMLEKLARMVGWRA
jgi:5'(3')-deoxyribonucleotidase